MSKPVLGIDISKLKFDVALLLPNNKVKTKHFNNNEAGFASLVEWVNDYVEQGERVVCMEATGSYGEALATYLYDKGYKVSVVNPAQIKGFGQAQLTRTKTDKADAKLIARFAQALSPAPWQPTPLPIRQLQAFIRRLEALQAMHQQESNRLETAPGCIQASIETIQAKLAQEIKVLKRQIKDHIDQNPDLHDKKGLLDTIPGIADATIAQILAFIGQVHHFNSAKQFAAFMGLNPKQHTSGSSVQKYTRLSKVGNAKLRKAFYMPAIVAKQHNPLIKIFCERLKAAGKSTMCIIGAAMRKLVHIVYGVLKSGKPFNPALTA